MYDLYKVIPWQFPERALRALFLIPQESDIQPLIGWLLAKLCNAQMGILGSHK